MKLTKLESYLEQEDQEKKGVKCHSKIIIIFFITIRMRKNAKVLHFYTREVGLLFIPQQWPETKKKTLIFPSIWRHKCWQSKNIKVSIGRKDGTNHYKEEKKHFKTHTIRNLHFLSINSTLISRENCRFFGWKTRENVVIWDFF